MTDAPFWLDWDYDQSNADVGTRSRYGNYLYSRTDAFREIWTDDPSVEFGALAWRIATGPVMAPPLVRSHRRIIGAHLSRSGWDGEMTADVQLVAPDPQPLANVRTVDGKWFRGWQVGAWDDYEPVGEQDVARHPYLLTTVRVLWTLPPGTVPAIAAAPTGSDALFRSAVECLERLVAALNREIGPIIERLDRP